SGVTQPLNNENRAIAEKIGPILKEKGLHFVGLDVIGNNLTEINITSPTCVRAVSRDSGIDVAGQLIECLLGKLNAYRETLNRRRLTGDANSIFCFSHLPSSCANV